MSFAFARRMRLSGMLLLSALLFLLTCGDAIMASAPGTLEESPERNKLFIAWPRDGTKVSASSTFIVGSTSPSKQIHINGEPARHNAQGLFAQVVNLKHGENRFVISFADGSGQEKVINVIHPAPPPPISPADFTIKHESIEPKVDMGVSVGDLVILKACATPGGELTVKIGNKRSVILSPAPAVVKARHKKASSKGKRKEGSKKSRGSKKAKRAGAANKEKSQAPAESAKEAKTAPEANLNEGLATAYGKVFQSLPANRDDLYVGFYKVQPGDEFTDTPLKFILKKDGRSMSIDSPGKLTVLTQPHVVQTTHDDTVIRVAPDKARLTPLPQGVRLLVDGWQADNLRCIYASGHHAYVKAEDAAYEKGAPQVSGAPPTSSISTVNIMRTAYGDAVVIPLSQRLPFTIEQSLNPNRLIVKVFGGVSNTDFVSQQYKPAFEEGQADDGSITRPEKDGGMVDGVTWKQANDDTYELNIKLRGHRQWGFFGSYSGTHLLINIKDPPRLAAGSLQGLSICLDPGHGGAQTGAMGCSGVSEAQLNLSIAMHAKRLLEAEGAKVTMTRVQDVDLDLIQRCQIARAQAADILLSIHNNSLPDGRDPWKEHGTSAYWYHPQSIELARALKDSVIGELGYPDMGARYQNLALTRPSSQLSVLVEVGFMINPDEYASLIKIETQERVARGLVNGLKRYLAGKE